MVDSLHECRSCFVKALANTLAAASAKHLPVWQANRNPVPSGVEGRESSVESKSHPALWRVASDLLRVKKERGHSRSERALQKRASRQACLPANLVRKR